MAGRTRDLAGAAFGEPWQARTRQGIPIKPPTWRIVATFPDGERLVVERRGATDAEAFERIDALRKRPFGVSPGARWTMQRVWDDWWITTSDESAAARRTLADGSVSRSPLAWQDATRLRYRGVWERHVQDKWSHRDPATVTRAEIGDWLREPRNVQPKMLLDALRVVCRHAEELGLMPIDPTRGGFRLTTRRPVPRPLSVDELERIERHLGTIQPSPRQPDAKRLLDGWIILRSTAARLSEMLALQVQDFDPHTGALFIGRRHLAKTVRSDGRSTTAVVEGTKTRAGTRRIPVTPDGVGILTKRTEGKAATEFIISDANGRWITPTNFSNALFREMRKIGIEATAHDLRDTLSTALAKEMVERRGLQAGLLAAARHLGHSSPKSLPAYVDDSQVTDPVIAEVVAASDPGSRRLAEVLETARRAGVSAPGISHEGDTIVVHVSAEPQLVTAQRALAHYDRVRVQLAAPLENVEF